MILVARYALILTFFLSSCNWQSNTETKVTGEIYGTTYKYIFNHPADKPSNELINQQILEELNRIDLIFSTYKQMTLSTFNRQSEKRRTDIGGDVIKNIIPLYILI